MATRNCRTNGNHSSDPSGNQIYFMDIHIIPASSKKTLETWASGEEITSNGIIKVPV